MKIKIICTLLTAAISATVITGCSGKPARSASTSIKGEMVSGNKEQNDAPDISDNAEASNKYKTVCLIGKGSQSPYWQSVLKGAQSAADELGVKLEFQGPDSEADIAQQVQMMNNAVQMSPSAIGLAALDVSTLKDAIKAAQDAGIPIIGFNSGVPEAPAGSVVANVVTDNYKAGEVAAENTYPLIADKMKEASGSVRIGVMNQDAVSESIINRVLGFIDKITDLIEADGKTVCIMGNDRFVYDAKAEKGDSAQVILEVAVPSKVEASLMTADAQTLLSKDDTICIFASNDKTSEGMITGDENLERLGNDVIGVAFDSGTMIKNAIKEGKLAGVVTEDPVEIGYQTVQIAVKAASGERVEDVDTGSQWYNAENIDTLEIADNLYD